MQNIPPNAATFASTPAASVPKRMRGAICRASRALSMCAAHASTGIQERSTTLEIAGHVVKVVSVGGWETCVQLPALRLAVDIGRCPPSAVNMETVAFTHPHMDHIGGIGMHVATRSMRKMTPPTYVVTESMSDDLRVLLRAFERLDRSQWQYKITPMTPGGASHALGKGRSLRAFPTYHTVPSQGYLVCSTKKKLLPQYSKLSQAEIHQLVRRGENLSESILVPEVAIPGDTTLEVLEREPDVRRAKLLIIEITFLDDTCSVEHARSCGHIHLQEVVENVHLFENEAVLFTHFSARYSAAEITRLLDERLPPALRRRATALTANHKF